MWGSFVGLIYAVAWLAVADRAAAGGRRLSSSFHGVAAIMIGFPLLWEASTRFGFLSPAASAGVLAVLSGLALAVARRRRLRLLAGLAMLGALTTTVGLVGASGALVASIAPALAGVPPNAGLLATLRTAVLAAAAVLLACARRYERTADLGWLLYPVLCAGGLKLLLEDFRYSEPSMLFVALGLFGAALVAAARLVKRGA